MKNPFRREPLTEDSLRRIRSLGLIPFTRVLIPLGRRRCIVLLTSDEREYLTTKDGLKVPLVTIAPTPKITVEAMEALDWREYDMAEGELRTREHHDHDTQHEPERPNVAGIPIVTDENMPVERTILVDRFAEDDVPAVVTVVSSEAWEGPSIGCMRPVNHDGISPTVGSARPPEDASDLAVAMWGAGVTLPPLDPMETREVYNRCTATTVSDGRVGQLAMTYRCDLEVGHAGDHHIGFPVNRHFSGDAAL